MVILHRIEDMTMKFELFNGPCVVVRANDPITAMRYICASQNSTDDFRVVASIPLDSDENGETGNRRFSMPGEQFYDLVAWGTVAAVAGAVFSNSGHWRFMTPIGTVDTELLRDMASALVEAGGKSYELTDSGIYGAVRQRLAVLLSFAADSHDISEFMGVEPVVLTMAASLSGSWSAVDLSRRMAIESLIAQRLILQEIEDRQ